MRRAGGQGAPTGLALGYVRAGHTGVDLFFVLSAFLLAQPFLAEAGGGRRVDRRDYCARRALRILPLYWAAVLAVTACTTTDVTSLGLGLAHLLFVQAFVVATHPAAAFRVASSVWWSLATEVQFYLVLPLLPVLVRRRALGAAVLALGAAAYAVIVLRTVRPPLAVEPALHGSLLGRGPVFLCGVLAAALYARRGDAVRTRLATSPLARNGAADLAMLAVVLILGACLERVATAGITAEFGRRELWHAVGGACWATILLCVLLAPLRTRLLWSNPVLARLGVLSYSIYLLHLPLIWSTFWIARTLRPGSFVGWSAETVPLVVAVTVACFTLSAVTYRWIERPFLARKVRFAA